MKKIGQKIKDFFQTNLIPDDLTIQTKKPVTPTDKPDTRTFRTEPPLKIIHRPKQPIISNKIVGIDLGTTNSLIAILNDGIPTIIPCAEGGRLIPSIVAINKAGERLVGQAAKQQAVENPENTIYSVKRFMGRNFKDPEVQRIRKYLPYKILEAPHGDVRIQMGAKAYSPPEISAMILQKLIIDAETYLGEAIRQVVITIPAYFNNSQRNATLDACKIVGLDVLRIINEPTAASLAYGLNLKSNETIAIYHLGGGTFDISILDIGEGVYRVRSTCGDSSLGGDDFDQRLIDSIADDYLQETNCDLRKDLQALERLREAVEKAKIELSLLEMAEIVLPFITSDNTGPKNLVKNITRSKFEHLTADLIERTFDVVNFALKDAESSA